MVESPAGIHKPTAKLREGQAMEETWQTEPRGQPTEVNLLVVETQAEPKSRQDQVTLKDTKAQQCG